MQQTLAVCVVQTYESTSMESVDCAHSSGYETSRKTLFSDRYELIFKKVVYLPVFSLIDNGSGTATFF